MKIETYEDGQLIETREVEDFIDTSPNVSGFLTAMLSNDSYNLLASTANELLRTRVEIAITRLDLKEITIEDLQLFKVIWDAFVADSPGGYDYLGWNAIALANNMPFTFDDDLKMRILI